MSSLYKYIIIRSVNEHKHRVGGKDMYTFSSFLRVSVGNTLRLKGQCPDYAHARASSVFSSKDNRTVLLTRQDFLPDAPPTEICCLYSQVIF